MYERRGERPVSRIEFFFRVIRHSLLAFATVLVALESASSVITVLKACRGLMQP